MFSFADFFRWGSHSHKFSLFILFRNSNFLSRPSDQTEIGHLELVNFPSKDRDYILGSKVELIISNRKEKAPRHGTRVYLDEFYTNNDSRLKEIITSWCSKTTYEGAHKINVIHAFMRNKEARFKIIGTNPGQNKQPRSFEKCTVDQGVLICTDKTFGTSYLNSEAQVKDKKN